MLWSRLHFDSGRQDASALTSYSTNVKQKKFEKFYLKMRVISIRKEKKTNTFIFGSKK